MGYPLKGLNMLDKIINFLSENWDQIRAEPLQFIICALIFLAIGFFLNNYICKERIETLKQNISSNNDVYIGQLNILKDRIAAKDDLLSEYRQRLHIADTHRTAYSQLTNEELKQNASKLVFKMREFLKIKNQHDSDCRASEWQQMQQARTEEERRKIWEEQTARSLRKPSINIEYNEKFRSDAILIRDEILSRLPKDQKNKRAYHSYEYPTNLLGLQEVVNDLEKLANNLPK